MPKTGCKCLKSLELWSNNKDAIMQNIKRTVCSIMAAVAVATIFPWAVSEGCGAPAVRPNSFKEVTAHLDAGGELYLYLSTAQWLKGLGAKVDEWRQVLASLPIPPAGFESVDKAINLLAGFIKESGLEEVSGVGISSVMVEPGLFRNREVIHHYRGEEKGFGWSMFGRRPHELSGLDLMPETTAFAIYMDLDLKHVWQAINKLAVRLGPDARNALLRFEVDFEKEFGVVIDKALDSFDGEAGFVLTLDDARKIPLPMFGGPNNPIQIPEPQLMLVLKVKDDTLYEAVGRSLNKALKGAFQKNDEGELKMMIMPGIPAPLPLPFRPTLAANGQYLFIATSDEIVKAALATKGGRRLGLKTTAEFSRLSRGLPTKGNGFGFTSKRLEQTLADLQQITARMAGGPQSLLMSKFSPMFEVGYDYGVFAVTDEGWITASQGSRSASEILLLPVAATVGIMAGIAIPNFVQARSTSQKNACIHNLRQLEAAKLQWALENKKKNEDVPTLDDLIGPQKYIRVMPACPAGGKYSLHSVEEKPTCSIPEHGLP